PRLEVAERDEETDHRHRNEEDDGARVDESARERTETAGEAHERDRIAGRAAPRLGNDARDEQADENDHRQEEGDDLALRETREHETDGGASSREEQEAEVAGPNRTPIERPQVPGPLEHRQRVEEREREKNSAHR